MMRGSMLNSDNQSRSVLADLSPQVTVLVVHTVKPHGVSCPENTTGSCRDCYKYTVSCCKYTASCCGSTRLETGRMPACVAVQVPPRVPQGLQAVGLRPALLLQPQQAAQLPPRQARRPVREGCRDIALPAQGVCALLARPGSRHTGTQLMFQTSCLLLQVQQQF